MSATERLPMYAPAPVQWDPERGTLWLVRNGSPEWMTNVFVPNELAEIICAAPAPPVGTSEGE